MNLLFPSACLRLALSPRASTLSTASTIVSTGSSGVAPTGKFFQVQHMHMFRVLDGLIAEHFANRDDVEMMRQLGLLIPAPPPPVR